jgi:hypothetical protein
MVPLSCVKKKGVPTDSFYHIEKNKSTPSDFHPDTNKGAFLYASRGIYPRTIGGPSQVEAGRLG